MIDKLMNIECLSQELRKIFAFLTSEKKKAKIFISYMDESHIWFNTKTCKYEICEPHEGNGNKWFFRKAIIQCFDRWANSCIEEHFYDTLEELMQRLNRI